MLSKIISQCSQTGLVVLTVGSYEGLGVSYDNILVQYYQILATWFCVCNAELFI